MSTARPAGSAELQRPAAGPKKPLFLPHLSATPRKPSAGGFPPHGGRARAVRRRGRPALRRRAAAKRPSTAAARPAQRRPTAWQPATPDGAATLTFLWVAPTGARTTTQPRAGAALSASATLSDVLPLTSSVAAAAAGPPRAAGVRRVTGSGERRIAGTVDPRPRGGAPRRNHGQPSPWGQRRRHRCHATTAREVPADGGVGGPRGAEPAARRLERLYLQHVGSGPRAVRGRAATRTHGTAGARALAQRAPDRREPGRHG